MQLLELCRFGMLGKYMGFLQNDQHNTGSLASWCQARHGGGSLLARVVGGGHGLCIATALFAIPFWCLGGHTKPGRIWMCSPTPVHFQSVCYQPFPNIPPQLIFILFWLITCLFSTVKVLDSFGLEDFLGGGNFKYVDSS